MRRITSADYLQRDWGEPVELVRGVPVGRPALNASARAVLDNLQFVTGRWRWHNAEQFERRAEPPVVISPDSVRHPPFAIYAAQESDAKAAPLVAVEFVRPGEQWRDAFGRATEELRAGVREVWIINPLRKNVQVFRRGDEPTVLAPDAELTTGLLPGFRCTVGDVFVGL